MKALPATILVVWSAVLLMPAASRWRFEHAEAARIRSHLSRVERALRQRDVSALAPAQRSARQAALDALHAYWRAGVFPHNHDFPGQRRPYFVDPHGTRCAMARLIENAGGGGLVERVTKTANNARVRELAGDPELLTWLDRNGMTVAEAAWVQPEYGDPPPNPIPFDDEIRGNRDRSYDSAVLAVEATGVALNIPRSWPWEARRLCGMYGFVGGIVGVASGLSLSGRQDSGLAGIQVLGGILTFALAVNNLSHPPPEEPVMASTPAPAWRARPLVRVNAEGEPQLAVRASF